MEDIVALLGKLDKRRIAEEVDTSIDEIREHYPLASVRSCHSCVEIIFVDFYQHLVSRRCHATFPLFEPAEALCDVRALLNEAYRSRNGDYYAAIYDAEQGINGGLEGVLDLIRETFKQRLTRAYVDLVFRDYDLDGEMRIRMLKQFFAYCGHELSARIRTDEICRYADRETFRRIITAYAQGRYEVIWNLNRY